MGAPNKGDIHDGYEFLGGDPNDKAAWQFWGNGARRLPNGSVVRDGPRGGLQTLRKADAGAEEQPLREFEVNAAGRATLMDQGLNDYEDARAQGYDPGKFRNVFARGMEGTGPGNFMADVIRDKPSERGRAAELQFVDGALRTTSGANAPEPEVVRANRAYFRQPGESPGVESNKAGLRRRFRDQSVTVAGRAYNDPSKGKEKPEGWTANLPPAQREAAMRYRSSIAPAGSIRNPSVPTDEDEYNALPSGAHYIHYTGKVKVKP